MQSPLKQQLSASFPRKCQLMCESGVHVYFEISSLWLHVYQSETINQRVDLRSNKQTCLKEDKSAERGKFMMN